MKKTVKMSIQEFLNGYQKEEALSIKILNHFKKYGLVYKIIGSTIIILTVGGGFDYAFAAGASGVDVAMNKIYMKVVSIGKWIIIIKGGIDTIKSAGDGDFPAAKKHFFSHLIVYLCLLGLPWGMDQVDQAFKELNGM